MPLIKSSSPAAFKTNVKTLMDEVGKSPHVQSRQQALAIAYATKRRGRKRGGMADGGDPADAGPVAPDWPQTNIDYLAHQYATNTRNAWPVSPEEIAVSPKDPMGAVGGSALRTGQNVVGGTALNAMTEPFSTRPRTEAEGWRDIGAGFGAGLLPMAPEVAAGIESGVGALGRGIEGLGAGTLGRGVQAGAKYAAPALGDIGTTTNSALAAQQASSSDWRNAMPANLKEQADETQKKNALQAKIDKTRRQMSDALSDLARKDRAGSPQAASYNKSIDGFQNQIDEINATIAGRQKDWLDANMPFYERYPLVNAGAPFVGLGGGLSSGLFVGKAGKALQQAKADAWNTAIKDNAELLSQPGWQGTERGQQLAGELANYQKKWPYINKPLRMAGAGLLGAGEGFVGSAFPTIYDTEFLPPGSVNQIEATKHWTDPYFWARIGAATGVGGIAGPIGAYYGMKKTITAPEERTAGLLAPRVASETGSATPEIGQSQATQRLGAPSGPETEPTPAIPALGAATPPLALPPPDYLAPMKNIAPAEPTYSGPWVTKTTSKNGRTQHRVNGNFASKAQINAWKAAGEPDNPYGKADGGPVINNSPVSAPRHYAFGGNPLNNWMERQENREMTHSGPIVSAVPGRTDKLNMNVKSGSYVLPAETISHLGQSNSIAGLHIANHMFGSGHGTGLPKPPAPMLKFARGGEATGHKTVPIVAAGGEFVIDPEVVARIGHGDVDQGHKILDAFVLHMRKQHLATIKKLKPPAKD